MVLQAVLLIHLDTVASTPAVCKGRFTVSHSEDICAVPTGPSQLQRIKNGTLLCNTVHNNRTTEPGSGSSAVTIRQNNIGDV
jgi:hypothetical protein